MHVALYARVSTSDQDTEIQLVELRRYVAARGWAVEGEFVDAGVSGSVSSRPALDRLRAAARRRDVDGVVVWRFDRFSRSITDLVASLEEFRTLGVAIVSIHEQIDTSSPTGRVVFAVAAAMAECEREILRERVKAGLARARKRRVRLGRPLKLDALAVLQLRTTGSSSVPSPAASMRPPRRSPISSPGTPGRRTENPAFGRAAAKPNANDLRVALRSDLDRAGKECFPDARLRRARLGWGLPARR